MPNQDHLERHRTMGLLFRRVSFYEFRITESPTGPPRMPARFGLRPVRNGHKAQD